MTMKAEQKKRVCISFKLDSEALLHQIAAITGYRKSEIIDASVRMFFQSLGINDGMTIAEVKTVLNSFFQQDIY